MFWVVVFFLVTMLAGGLVFLSQSYLYFRKRNSRAMARYKKMGISTQQLSSLSTHFGWQTLLLGAWFLTLPVLIVLFRIPFHSFTVLIMVGTGILFLGDRLIERKHGIKTAQ